MTNRSDINTPDLYIPLMSFMTYILISCLSMGIGKNFNPEIITTNIFKCTFISLFELLIYKLGNFFFWIYYTIKLVNNSF